jgi:hypothetical protein
MRIPIRGGPPAPVLDLPGVEQAILATPVSVLVAVAAPNGSSGRISSVPLDGGPGSVLATTHGSISGGLATDGALVYFSDADGTKSVSLAGGSVATVTGDTGEPALVGSNLIIAESASGNLVSLPPSGGPATVLASAPGRTSNPFACGSALCWLTYPPPQSGVTVGSGTIALMELSAGTTKTLSQSAPMPWRILFDGTNFLETQVGGSLLRVPGGGGDAADTGLAATGVAVDESCVYLSDVAGGIRSVDRAYVASAHP